MASGYSPSDSLQYGSYADAASQYGSSSGVGGDDLISILSQYFGQPTTTSQSGGGGGGGGGGSSSRAPAQDAIRTLYGLYNAAPDQTHLNLLNQFADQSLAQGNTAIDALRTELQGQQSPYANIQLQPQVAATNPLGDYMQQTGSSTSSTDALMSMLNSQNATSASNANALMQQLNSSNQAAQAGRMQDLSTAQASFQQQLANTKLGYQQQEADLQQGRRDQYMRSILEYAMKYGIDLKKLGINFGAPQGAQ